MNSQVPLAVLADLINGFPFDSENFAPEGDVPLVRIRDILNEPFQTFVPTDAVPEWAYIRDGDVVIGMDGDFNVVHWSRGKAALNQRVCVVRAKEHADSRFLAYALPSMLTEINELTFSTTVKHLSSKQIRAIRLPTHTLQEQRVIADFLDHESAQIDAFIAKSEQLITLLAERRAAVVDHVVWSGLGDDVVLGPSGVAPAPPSPEHWLRRRNKNLFRERTDVSEKGSEELLTVSHITGVTPRSEKNVNMFEAESNEGYKMVSPGDLAINTMWAWMGAAGVSPVDGIVSPAYGVYASHSAEYEPRYYDRLIRSTPYVTEMTRYSKGIVSSRLRLYPDVFLALPTVIPPLAEQRAIADYLDAATAKTDSAIATAQRSIGLARERRAALIVAAVTGQMAIAS